LIQALSFMQHSKA